MVIFAVTSFLNGPIAVSLNLMWGSRCLSITGSGTRQKNKTSSSSCHMGDYLQTAVIQKP